MSMLRPRRVAAAAVGAALFVASIAGCGDESADPASAPATGASTGSSAHAGEGEWLLRFTTAGGPDGEKVGAVYVRYNPTTGATASRRLPPLTASDAAPEEDALLVSADHTLAVQDTAVPKAQAQTGKLVLYSLTSEATETLDLQAATGQPGVVAVAWAFDPSVADLMRVVDADGVVWKVHLGARTATKERTLPTRDGWIFGNGFDRNTGEPYIESIDSDQTDPAGNGTADTQPVARQGGTLFQYDGGDLDGLPKPPCDFAGGFRFDDGLAWLFCGDTPSVTAHQAAKGGASWHQFGSPSAAAVPDGAVELSFALPPVG